MFLKNLVSVIIVPDKSGILIIVKLILRIIVLRNQEIINLKKYNLSIKILGYQLFQL